MNQGHRLVIWRRGACLYPRSERRLQMKGASGLQRFDGIRRALMPEAGCYFALSSHKKSLCLDIRMGCVISRYTRNFAANLIAGCEVKSIEILSGPFRQTLIQRLYSHASNVETRFLLPSIGFPYCCAMPL
jgi:hypothetical protein